MKTNRLFCIELRTDNCKLKTAITAAAVHKLHAAATAEHSAEIVSFQRQQPNLPPTQNVDSALLAELPAGHFSGKVAIVAKIANHLQYLQQ